MLGLLLVAGLLWFVLPGLGLWLAWRLRRTPRRALAKQVATPDPVAS